jgi:hypothetical protein
MFLTVRDRHSKTHPRSNSQAVQSTQTEGQGLDAPSSQNEPTDFIRHSFYFFQLKPKPISCPERSGIRSAAIHPVRGLYRLTSCAERGREG